LTCVLPLQLSTEPNSWFGLNRQDYWSWIEPLQDYYFNEKQNPLLRDVVNVVTSSTKVTEPSSQRRGKCGYILNKGVWCVSGCLLQTEYLNQNSGFKVLDKVRGHLGAILDLQVRTVQGKGRCFLRIALCQKIISVPIDHLVRNARLTSYWYSSDSIINSPTLRSKVNRVTMVMNVSQSPLSVCRDTDVTVV